MHHCPLVTQSRDSYLLNIKVITDVLINVIYYYLLLLFIIYYY